MPGCETASAVNSVSVPMTSYTILSTLVIYSRYWMALIVLIVFIMRLFCNFDVLHVMNILIHT